MRTSSASLALPFSNQPTWREAYGALVQSNPDFLRLANPLSALYPKESEEKRLLDAMLPGVP
jgi:hypothetical protein